MASDLWLGRALGWWLPRLALTAAVVLVPALVIFRTVGNYGGKCHLVAYFDLVPVHDCKYWQAAYVFCAAAAAFGLITLFWNRLGLAHIFETPWFGLGEDVENASLLESIVRAAVFIVFLWLGLGMAAVATIGVMNIQALLKDTSQTGQGGSGDGGQHQGQLVDLAPQLEKLNENLKIINDRLAKLDFTNGQPESGDDTKRNVVELRDALGAILKQLEASNGRLANIDLAAGKSEQHLAANGQQLAAAEKRAAIYEASVQRHLETVDRIYDVLVGWERSDRSTKCFEYPVASAENRGAASSGPRSDASTQPSRYRTIAEHPIFFDVNSVQLSAWAQQDLLWFLRTAPSTSELVAVHGSADPQGATSNNRKLAENRAKAMEDFIKANSELRVQSEVTSAGESGDPKSEPYKRVAAVRMLVPCPR